MARPLREAPSASALPPALLRCVAAAARQVAAAGALTVDVAELDEVPITSSALAAMLDAACVALADPHLALRLPSELRFRRYDALTLAARASSSPRDVLELFVRFAPLVFPSLGCGIEGVTRELRFRMQLARQPRGLGLATDEYLLATAITLATRGLPIRPRRVWLTASRPRRLDPLFAAFGTEEIDFGAESTGFAFATEDADRELPGGDPMLVATAQDLARAALSAVPRQGAFGEAIASAIEGLLGEGASPSAEQIATAMRMSIRTLQRRLDDEGLRFSRVLDDVRERRARKLLVDASIPLAEVAYCTGFADLATFSRAFKRWSGLPPGAFRARHGRDA
jgi:AraC-like DNA-binding protein